MEFDVHLIGNPHPLRISHPAHSLEELSEDLFRSRGIIGELIGCDSEGSAAGVRILLPQNRIQLIAES
jgi:hypothetical protein